MTPLPITKFFEAGSVAIAALKQKRLYNGSQKQREQTWVFFAAVLT